MKTNIIVLSNNILRVLSLLVQGFVFGSKFARAEFRNDYFWPFVNSLGGVGAWAAVVICCAAMFSALYGLLWLGYYLGFIM